MNGIILINKPKGFTSRDVVNKLGGILHTKKLGHTGTLDPIATGVLVVCIGNATKLCEVLTSEYKEYVGTIQLGVRTDTLDVTGNVVEKKDYDVNEDMIREVLHGFLGKSIQTTPIYSAVKVNGKKLYEYAREGKTVELPKREIDIQDIEFISYEKDKIVFRAVVSKGTYIRALIDDICVQLGTVGTMCDLVRTKQGKFAINESYSLEEVESGNYKILSIEEVLSDIETLYIDEKCYEKVKNGSIIKRVFNGNMAVFKYQNKVVAIYKVYDKDERLAKPFKMFIN